MFESATGLIAPANRQKAGRLAIGLPPGGVKLPAGTDSAMAMEAPASLSRASASQGVDAKADTLPAMHAKRAKTARTMK
jgi:hypothetical protein